MKSNVSKLMMAALIILFSAGVSLADGWKDESGKRGHATGITRAKWFISTITPHRQDLFMLNDTIDLLSSGGIITVNRSDMWSRHRVGSFSGCRLQKRVQHLASK